MSKEKIDYSKDHIIEGRYRTIIHYKDGRIVKDPPEDQPMKKNLIVNTAGDVVAALFMGEASISPNFGNIHYAIGNGNPAWDSLPDKGKSNQTITVTDLVAEVARILPTTKIFIDGWDGSPVPSGFSNYVRLIYNLDDTVAPDEFLREFGLYVVGDSAINSGYLFDYVIHASFQKTSDIYLYQREFEIKF